MNPYESKVMNLSKKQRYILVHSYLYYELDDPVISDKQYDEAMIKLALDLEAVDQETLYKTDYGYAFVDFDGSTGYYLYESLFPCDQDKIRRIAGHIRSVGP